MYKHVGSPSCKILGTIPKMDKRGYNKWTKGQKC